MKKSEKRLILILIIVAIVVIAVLVKVKMGKNGDSDISNQDNVAVQQQEPIEEFVDVLEDGTKLNTSTKLSETKKFENYEISNIQLTEFDGQSLILADVKNIGETKADMTLIDITILDKEGNQIAIIGGIIGDVEPGETVQLNASATTDFANAYDFTISRTDNSAVEAVPEATE